MITRNHTNTMVEVVKVLLLFLDESVIEYLCPGRQVLHVDLVSHICQISEMFFTFESALISLQLMMLDHILSRFLP